MTLSYVLARHESSVRASLRAVYGVDLRQVMSDHTVTVLDLADLVLWLPPGCAFWMDFGGPAALSMEVRELRRVGYWLRILEYRERGSKGEKPKPDTEPEHAAERQARQDQMSRKAAAHMRRQSSASAS